MGVRGAISQKAHYQIFKNSHQIEVFRSPGNIKLADFTEMKMTLLEGCVVRVLSKIPNTRSLVYKGCMKKFN